MKKSILWMFAAILTCGLVATVLTACSSSSDDDDQATTYSYGIRGNKDMSSETSYDSTNDFTQYKDGIKASIDAVIKANTTSWEVKCTKAEAQTVGTTNNKIAREKVNAFVAALNAIKDEVAKKDKNSIKNKGHFEFRIDVVAYNSMPDGVANGEFIKETVLIEFDNTDPKYEF